MQKDYLGGRKQLDSGVNASRQAATGIEVARYKKKQPNNLNEGKHSLLYKMHLNVTRFFDFLS